MNENIDLTKILKDCPKGTKLYSIIFGEVEFVGISCTRSYPIEFKTREDGRFVVSCEGKMDADYYDAECTLFPSREKRDWSKFTAPWYKKEKFDPKTLKPFDKALVKMYRECVWRADIISAPANEIDSSPITIGNYDYDFVIPYNDDTKHLVGTLNEAPEYYRYWEA